MARHDGNLLAAAGRELGLGEWLAVLTDAPVAPAEGQARTEAIARYLAGGDGWKQAAERLSGAFAGAADQT